jgi:hypothetical protein
MTHPDADSHAWTSDELAEVDATDELRIASERPDGTLSKAVTIWVVRLGDDLYVRSVNGPTGVWFRGTERSHRGRVWAGGVEKDVAFATPDGELGDRVDAAYRTKYRRYAKPIVEAINTPAARSATLKLIPRPYTTTGEGTT